MESLSLAMQNSGDLMSTCQIMHATSKMTNTVKITKISSIFKFLSQKKLSKNCRLAIKIYYVIDRLESRRNVSTKSKESVK